MATTVLQWFALIQGGIITIASIFFLGIMIKNFIKKKTIGTAFLAIFYGFFAVTQAANTIFNIYSLYYPLVLGHKITLLVYIASIAFSYIVLYNFASRHILNDNDIVRLVNSFLLIGLPAFVIGMLGYELFTNVLNPIFYTIELQPGTEFLQYMPSMITGIVMYAPFLLLVHFRIIFSMSFALVKNKIKDPIKRKGWQYILYSVIALILTVFLTVAFTFDGISPGIVITLYIVRAILSFFGLFFSYLGWILPSWFKNRITQKTWLAKNLKANNTPTVRFITSKTFFEETKITELNE
ncbi:MAG: hypothetical protein ACFFDW_05090 [Candidatus Thorarchaeota archaeon]